MEAITGRRVLVAGGTGFLGTHVTRRLLDAGADVTVLSRHPDPSRFSDVASRLRFVQADVSEPGAARDAVRGVAPEVWIHVAGSTAGRTGTEGPEARRSLVAHRRREVRGWFALLEDAAPGVTRIVRVGSMDEYGDVPSPYDETQPPAPASAYGAAQAEATALAHRLAGDRDLSLVTLRLSLVYGPAQSEDFFLPSLIAACLANRPFPMTDGRQRCDFLYVADAAEALHRAAERPDVTGVLNVGSGFGVSLRHVSSLVAARARPGWAPDFGALPRRAGEPAERVLSIGRAYERLGWRPVTPLERGLDVTIQAGGEGA